MLPAIRISITVWLAACSLALAPTVPAAQPDADGSEPRPNVLLVLVDTLRADHLHAYGYPQSTSDEIDALATQGWLFENHLASSSQTVPSTLSLMLSRHPAEHGFLHLGIGHFARNRPRYPEAFLFLPEVFAAAGYATAGFMGNPFLQRKNGFAQGYDAFVYRHGPGDELTTAAVAWLRQREPSSQPFFMYLHYFDVHAPYQPPGEFGERFPRPPNGRALHKNGRATVEPADLQASIALYDGEIAFVDHQIGQLLGALGELGLRDRTWIAVTSDHGEEFMDHGGLGHGTTVYGELVQVPLVLAGPGLANPGRRIDQLTHHIDLAPTLLALAGIDRPAEFRGGMLTKPVPEAYAEEGPWLAIHSQEQLLKLILNRQTGASEMFAMADKLDQKPLEPRSRLADRRRLLERARWYAELKPLQRVLPPSESTPQSGEESSNDWSPAERKQLEALGYAQ